MLKSAHLGHRYFSLPLKSNKMFDVVCWFITLFPFFTNKPVNPEALYQFITNDAQNEIYSPL